MVTSDIRKFKVLDSTNTYLKALAENGEKEGVVVVADKQTSGRGRRGKSFFSPDGTGLYMSILLRPDKEINDPTYITTATAVALRRAIKKVYNKSTLIKWVNDIYLDGKKLAHHDGGYSTWRVDMTDSLREKSLLVIVFTHYCIVL